ncbi:MAG: hypothetical protein NT120_00465 [Candidatus Aenigmarchaeota archaeon]|nr:hypothetical protein [Candidatus Aenigmarchaeota archaeon]
MNDRIVGPLNETATPKTGGGRGLCMHPTRDRRETGCSDGRLVRTPAGLPFKM